jgi:RNA polymerase sigma-70 factor (ECF subfamily)
MTSDPVRAPTDSRFESTEWTVVRRAAGSDAAARTALAELCRQYWYPIYAYIRRRTSADQAEDLTQEFFAHLLAAPIVASADPALGKFRAFLLACCNHFLANERARAAAQKRGGGEAPVRIVPFDSRDAERRFDLEPADHHTPEWHFDRQWALTLLEVTLRDLAEECAQKGDDRLFQSLKPMLAATGEAPARYAEIAADLDSTEAAVKKAAQRLRERYGAILRGRIAATVDGPEGLDQEVRDLFAAVRP